MDDQSRRTLAKRYEWVSYHLEREAYRQQMEGRTNPLRRFYPCGKAIIFTAAMGTDQPSSVVIRNAALVACTCHNSLTENDLHNLYSQATKAHPQQ